jgi:hypothetical protein
MAAESTDPKSIPLDAKAFQAALQELGKGYAALAENPQGYQLKDCEHCSFCMFCTGCSDCYRCTHCERCEQCSQCTHCKDCVGCHGDAYCVGCRDCVGSKYLEQCSSCAECTYCFGCVGLSKREFHILNQPFDKLTYFALVSKLRQLKW